MRPLGTINGGRENPDGVRNSNVGISSFLHFRPAAMATSLAVSRGFGSRLTVDNSVQCLSSSVLLYVCLTLVYFLCFPSHPNCFLTYTEMLLQRPTFCEASAVSLIDSSVSLPVGSTVGGNNSLISCCKLYDSFIHLDFYSYPGPVWVHFAFTLSGTLHIIQCQGLK